VTDSILITENLTKEFDGFKAINNLNFSMEPGELRVVIGPNGAGKTTFLDLITGKLNRPPDRYYLKVKMSVATPKNKFRDWVSVGNFKHREYISISQLEKISN
jgi:urea transport system ATP-binding protein